MENTSELYGILFQQSKDGVFIIDYASGQVIDANQAFLDIFGYKLKEIKKLTVTDLLADPAEQAQVVQKLRQEDGIKDYLLHVRRKDGAIRQTMHTVTAQKDGDGRIQKALGMVRDVTAQRHNEALTQQRQKLLEALSGLSQDVAAQQDPKLILETAARRVVELFDATSGYISDFDEEQGTDRIIVEYYAPKASKKERHSDLGQTYTLADLEQTLAIIKEQNYYLYHADDPATPPFEAGQLKKYGGQTILGVPLMTQGELIGILEVWDSRQKRQYTANEVEMIQAVGRQVALAVNNARYITQLEKQIQERQRAENALRAREEIGILNQEKLKALQEVTTELDRTPSLAQLYQQAIVLGQNRLGFERLGLLLLDEDTKLMRGTFGVNEAGELTDEREMLLPPGDHFLQLMASNERAVLWEDVPLYTQGEEIGHGWNAIAVLWDGAKGIGWLATDNFISQSPPPPYLLDILTLYADTVGHLISRKRSEESLRESEQRLSHLVQQSPLAVIEWNLNFEVREWNLAAESIFKYSRANALGQHARFIIPAEYHAHVDAVWEGLVTQTGGSRSTNDNVTAEGHIITCEWYNTPLVNEEGEVIGVVSLVQDITEQQELQRQVQESLIMRDRQVEIGRALTAAQTEAEILQTIVTHVDLYPHVACSVTLIEAEGDSLVDVIKAQNGHESGLSLFPLQTRRPHEDNPLATHYTAEKTFISENMARDKRLPAAIRKEFKKAKIRSLATLPLTAGGEWLGNLTLMSQQEDFFNDQTLLLYQSVAEQGAIALRAARLFQEVQSSLARREREVAVSTQIAQEIASATDLSDLYRRVVNQIQEQFDYYHTQLLRYDPGMETLALTVGYGEVGEKMLAMNYSIPVGVGLIGLAAGTRRPILRPYLTNDADWQPNPLLPQAKGELAVPIKLGNEVLGVLDVQSDAAGALNENDQLILEGLCGQIAVAIESTTLRQDMEARLRELSILQRQMSREGWQEYRATRQLTAGYQYDHAGIYPLTPEKKAPTNGQGQNGKKSGDTAVAAPAMPIDAPLQIRGETIGSLGINTNPDQPLTKEEEEFLTAVSKEIAEALEAARLFEQTQDALAEQERLTSELETVAQVSTAASTILEVDALLQAVVDLSKSSFNLYHVHIYLINETGRKLNLKAGAGNVGRLMALEGREISIDAESLVARAARTRQGVLENSVRKTVDFMPHPLLPNTQSEMAIPLIVGDKLIGVLDLQSDQPDNFTTEDLKIQRTLASQVAIAVENARQYAEQVETSVKLREVDQLKSEFLASMSHELRTPLNSIIGFADVLLEGLDGELNERMEEDVRLIRESGRHLRELIGDILDMSKIEAGRMEMRYEEVDLRQMANDIMATASPLASEKNLDMYLDLDDNVSTIQADRTRLRQVLWNIMGNAIKFTDKGSVSLSIHDHGGHVLFAIRDTGIGIKEENIAVVFEQFRQIDGGLNRAVGGTGLGMPITKKLVEIHGGDIWIESVYGQGTTFFFTLPYIPPEW